MSGHFKQRELKACIKKYGSLDKFLEGKTDEQA
jgi:hypothetical protein